MHCIICTGAIKLDTYVSTYIMSYIENTRRETSMIGMYGSEVPCDSNTIELHACQLTVGKEPRRMQQSVREVEKRIGNRNVAQQLYKKSRHARQLLREGLLSSAAVRSVQTDRTTTSPYELRYLTEPTHTQWRKLNHYVRTS